MTWIETIGEERANGDLARLYERMSDPLGGGVANILKCQSLHSEALAAHHALYRAVMAGTRSLRKAEREMIAVTVSRLNDCHY